MVQVDMFWGYGWGAGLAVAAGAQLLNETKPYETRYWANTLVFLSLFWAPTGLLLLLRHPSWETMQAAPDLAAMSEWLVLAFGITNITQGMLGFAVGLWLLRTQRYYAAQLNWLFGYFGMFFILLYGWDGQGYDRFLYDRDMFAGSPPWTPFAATGDGVWSAIVRFTTTYFNPAGSPTVITTLLTDGLWLLPPFYYLLVVWSRDGVMRSYAPGHESRASRRLALFHFLSVFVVALSSAALAALTVNCLGNLFSAGANVFHNGFWQTLLPHVLSYLIGLPLAMTLLWIFLLAPGRLFHHFLRPLWEPYQSLSAAHMS